MSPAAVPRITLGNLCRQLVGRNLRSFAGPATCAFAGIRVQKHFYRRVREHYSAYVPPFHHHACGSGYATLNLHHGAPNSRHGSYYRGSRGNIGGPDCRGHILPIQQHQIWRQQFNSNPARQLFEAGFIAKAEPAAGRRQRDTAIHSAGIDVGVPQTARQTPRNCALARARRSVDCDHLRHPFAAENTTLPRPDAWPYNNCISSPHTTGIGCLVTEQTNPASARIDQLGTEEMLAVINSEDRLVAESIAPELSAIARAVDAIVTAFRAGGRLFYIGAGTSGRLGVLDAAECPPTFNVPSDMVQGIMAGGESALARATEASEDDAASGARDLAARGFTAHDVVCGITASGRTPYVLGAMDLANQMGAATIGLCCTPGSELSRHVRISIAPVPGPEIIAGSTRLKAGTATKLVLNMLTTGAFIRLGYVRGNLMVNVQPKNEKLLDRALRIICAATGVSATAARQLLLSADNNVRAAIQTWESQQKKQNG